MSPRIGADKAVLILGGTPEAARVAAQLVRLAYRVHWLCGEAPDTDALDSPNLTLHAASELVRLDGHVGGLAARLSQDGQHYSVNASALVVAVGNERFFPAERYGVQLSSNVLALSQLEQQLAAARSTGPALPHRNQRVAFVLDLGGETGKEMAVETLRAALAVRQQWHAEVLVFYQNLKVDSYALERLTREIRAAGVVFCRYADPTIAVEDEGVLLTTVEGELAADLLVLPEATRPRSDAPALAGLLRLHLGADGFFQDINVHNYRPGLSERRGIFLAGRCHLDAAPEDLAQDADQAVANVDALLGSGYLEPEAVVAHVDSAECIRCLTCVRTCPHAAVEVVDDGTVLAACVVELACHGCGACVANCPVHAIELVGLALPAWMQWI